MKINNIKTALATLLLTSALTACSKPDVTGVWIPEAISSEDITYSYFEIQKMEGTDRLKLLKYTYSIHSPLNKNETPYLLDKPRVKVLEFTKDNTYCVEGSLNTECVVAVDGGKLDIYREGRFKKSVSNPPKIPRN